MNVLVSIVLPNYNKDKYLRQAVQSILDQTYTNFELIIVDDASTDRSMSILDGFQDSRVKVLSREANGGLANAYNMGILASQGDFIMFWNSDDVMRRNHVNVMVNGISGRYKDFDCIGSHFKYMTNYGLKFGHSGNWSPALLKLLRQRRTLPFNVPSAIFRSNVFKKGLLFDPKLRQCEDFDFMHRLSLNHPIAFMHQHFCGYYRLNLESLSSAGWEEQVRIQKHFQTSGSSMEPTFDDLIRIRFRRALVLMLYGRLFASIPHLFFSLRDPKYVLKRIFDRLI